MTLVLFHHSGHDVIPWMGKLSNLGPASLLPTNPYGANDSTPFPIKVRCPL